VFHERVRRQSALVDHRRGAAPHEGLGVELLVLVAMVRIRHEDRGMPSAASSATVVPPARQIARSSDP